ncbi:MAG TPA: IS701 family transposase [Pseudonocardiaceae bacterium]|jgi:SRSO17 transposase
MSTAEMYEYQEVAADKLREYCDFVLGTLSRADQRRWGEVYVRGLLYCEGRRSIKRIAEQVGGCSDQSLQQFVNQSPWDPHPVRQRLASVLSHWLRPTAWVLEEVAFDKYGQQSAGVERQFVPSQGRVRNCQLGAVAMLASENATVPVDWRLSVPKAWDDDPARRKNAHLPPDQRHQPYWRYQVEMLDDLSGDWGVPLAPVLVDARCCKAPEQLVAELENRGLEYLVRLSSEFTARHRMALDARRVDGARPARIDQRPVRRFTVVWQPPALAHHVRSQFAMVPAHLPVPVEQSVAAARQVTLRRTLLMEWRLGGATPRGYWLTNMNDRSVAELASLVKIGPRARYDLDELTGSVGLGHHEGRSFGGWHHHVTLVSVAQAFRVLESMCPPGASPIPDEIRRPEFCW